MWRRPTRRTRAQRYKRLFTSLFAVKPSTLLDICKKTATAWMDDYAPSMGAAISYYTAFSIAPLLVIVIAIAGYVFGEDAVRGALQSEIAGLVGNDGAVAIQGLISSASEPTEGLVASGVSLVVLLIGATTVFAEIQSALDRIWHVPEKAKPSGLWGLLRARFLSFGLILGLAFLLMASLAIAAAVSAMGTYFSSLLPGWEILLLGINFTMSLLVETLVFAMIFKLMPSTRIAWSDVWVGALVTAALFELGKLLIGLYVGKAGISSTYAAAGSIAVILIWVYYAAQIFLLGAEFTKVYAGEHGSLRSEPATVAPENPVRSEDPAPAASAGAGHTFPLDGRSTALARQSVEVPELPLDTRIRIVVIVGGALAMRAAVVSLWARAKRRRQPQRTAGRSA
jgi:membrane protein